MERKPLITLTDVDGSISCEEPTGEELVECVICGKVGFVKLGYIVAVWRDSEKVFCSCCHIAGRMKVDWFGAVCAFVYDQTAVHDIFGSPFDRLWPVPHGVVLGANNLKLVQLELF